MPPLEQNPNPESRARIPVVVAAILVGVLILAGVVALAPRALATLESVSAPLLVPFASSGAPGNPASSGAPGNPGSSGAPEDPTSPGVPGTQAPVAPPSNPGVPANPVDPGEGAGSSSAAHSGVSRTVRVVRTCGKDGQGDCFLTERSQAVSSSYPIRQWQDGESLQVTCQAQGESIASSVLGASTDIWSRTTGGGWVSNAFLEGVDTFDVTQKCADATSPAAGPAGDDAVARQRLAELAGQSSIRTDGHVLVELSGKWPGVSDPLQTAANGSHTFYAADIVAFHEEQVRRFGPSVKLVRSTAFGKQINHAAKPSGEVIWLTVYDPGTFRTEAAATDWCRASFPALEGRALTNSCATRRAQPSFR